jgi:sugar phosphate isomerase/epimerase
MLGPDDIVMCSGTLINASLREMVEASAATGCAGLSLWLDDVERAQADGMSYADIASLLADNGLQVAELDPLLSWFQKGSLGEGAADDAANMLGRSEEEFFALADALGGTVINCAHPFGGNINLDQAAEIFAGLCDRAKEHNIGCAIEFLPWTGIKDVTAAAEIVRRAGRANGGILFDTWHHLRGSNDDDALRAVPGEFIHAIQVNSAPAKANGNPMVESMHERLLPDEGDIDVANLIGILDSIGSKAAIGIEVFSDELNKLPPTEAAHRCVEATKRVMAKARS